MKERKMQGWVMVLGMTLIIGASVAVSAPLEVSAATPCCSITAMDTKTGIVTAKDTATGETIEFRLGDAAKGPILIEGFFPALYTRGESNLRQ